MTKEWAIWTPALSLGLATALSSSAFAGSPEVLIGERNGGELLLHVNQAPYMMSTSQHYRVVGDRYSAAAMQVVFIESQFPDRICATKWAKLHFHLAMTPETGAIMKEPDWMFTAFIRPENFKRLGQLPEFGHGFKTVKASDYLGLCKTKTVNCNVIGCGE